MGNQWSRADIPDLTGKHIIVTGGNRGLGYASVVELARRGAHVVLTSRSREKGDAAVAEIKRTVPGADVETMELDCSSFASVRAFAREWGERHGNKLDVLLNNAGVAETEGMRKVVTDDGHELLWQTNVWAPCLLTMLLLPHLADGATEESPARVVFISSVTATMPKIKIDLEDPESEKIGRDEGKHWTYPHTKCADWMIVNALSRRLEGSSLGGRVRAVCAHPGFSSTDMTAGFGRLGNALMGMPPSEGCLPQVRAAVDPGARSGEFYGPNTRTRVSVQHLLGMFGMTGHNPEPELYGRPMPSALTSPNASDAELCEGLLCKAEEITGGKFDIK